MGDAIIEMNVEHRTSNVQHRMKNRKLAPTVMGDGLDVAWSIAHSENRS